MHSLNKYSMNLLNLPIEIVAHICADQLPRTWFLPLVSKTYHECFHTLLMNDAKHKNVCKNMRLVLHDPFNEHIQICEKEIKLSIHIAKATHSNKLIHNSLIIANQTH